LDPTDVFPREFESVNETVYVPIDSMLFGIMTSSSVPEYFAVRYSVMASKEPAVIFPPEPETAQTTCAQALPLPVLRDVSITISSHMPIRLGVDRATTGTAAVAGAATMTPDSAL
jgi:hypothetical protein